MSTAITREFRLMLELPLLCPQCGDPVGYLFEKEGVCLSCLLNNEARDEYERREPDLYWGPAELTEARLEVRS